jgi:hypothetical protein
MTTDTVLLPDVHAVRVGDDIVFLDAVADRYLCWPLADGLLLSDDRRRLAIRDRDAVSDLESAGLISRSVIPSLASCGLPEPFADLWPNHSSPPGRGDRWALTQASWDAAVVYPRQTFAELLNFGRARAPAAFPDAEPDPEMIRLVSGFHRWAYWVPAPAKCLIRSFILLRHLRRHGLDARWVFAVRTWPFQAHCWLQAGATVLDDARERLAPYHPILVV